jgi:hypothetical protein
VDQTYTAGLFTGTDVWLDFDVLSHNPAPEHPLLGVSDIEQHGICPPERQLCPDVEGQA